MNLHNLSPYIRYVRITRIRGLTPAYVDPEYVLTYIVAGEGVFIFEGTKYYVKKGDLILIPPYMTHIIQTDNDDGINQYILHFDLFFNEKRSGAILKEEGMSFKEYAQCKDNPESLFCYVPYVISANPVEMKKTEEIFLEIKDDFESKDEYYELALKAGMLELLRIYLRITLQDKEHKKKILMREWKNIEKAIQFIHNNYSRQLRLKDVSAASGLSMSYFCRLFKNYTGASVHQYINTIRIKEAAKNLIDGELNLSQIAEKVGFSSIYLFSRIFKKIENVPPSKFISETLLPGKKTGRNSGRLGRFQPDGSGSRISKDL